MDQLKYLKGQVHTIIELYVDNRIAKWYRVASINYIANLPVQKYRILLEIVAS